MGLLNRFGLVGLILVFLIFSQLFSIGKSSAPLTIEQVFYVSPLGNDNDSGSESNPFRSIQYAIDKIASSKVSDKILLMPGDFHLTSAIEVNGISEITIEAQNKSDPPRLLRWGIELLSGPNYLQYVKLDTIIFESSRALRISGLLQRIVITNCSFLQLGPATSEIIRLDQVQVVQFTTEDNPKYPYGLTFQNCRFDTRDSWSDHAYFLWNMVGHVDSQLGPSQLFFDNCIFRGGLRSPLILNFFNVHYVNITSCTMDTLVAWMFANSSNIRIYDSTFREYGLLFQEDASNLIIEKNIFQNINQPFPDYRKKVGITFANSYYDPPPQNVLISNVYIRDNYFDNIQDTSVETGIGAITFAPSNSNPSFSNVSISENYFDMLSPLSTQSKVRGVAIFSNWSLDHGVIDAEENYYGGESLWTCCSPDDSKLYTVSPSIHASRYCKDSDCKVTLPNPICQTCPTQNKDTTGLIVGISLAVGVIVAIIGAFLMWRYLTRCSKPSLAVPEEGWRSRLLQSVPDIPALFVELGVPYIQYSDLEIKNNTPIGSGSFGTVFEGRLLNPGKLIGSRKEISNLFEALSGISPTYQHEDLVDDGLTLRPTFVNEHSPTSVLLENDELADQEIRKSQGRTYKRRQEEARTTRNGDTLTYFRMETGKERKRMKKKKDTSKPVAIKMLNTATMDAYEDLKQLLEEVKIMQAIDHPNLLKLHGVSIDPNSEGIMLVMELMANGSLDDVIFKNNVQLSFSRKLTMATEIGYALHYLHSKDPAICHRDLKPGNVLVGDSWSVKVCDFGSSRVLDRKIATMTTTGSPVYMAPESYTQNKFSESSDVYGYGITLVELFSGVRAYHDLEGSSQHLLYKIAYEGLRPTIPKALPTKLRTLIKRCMRTRPETRPTFTTILQSLSEIRESSFASGTDFTGGSTSNSRNQSAVNTGHIKSLEKQSNVPVIYSGSGSNIVISTETTLPQSTLKNDEYTSENSESDTESDLSEGELSTSNISSKSNMRASINSTASYQRDVPVPTDRSLARSRYSISDTEEEI